MNLRHLSISVVLAAFLGAGTAFAQEPHPPAPDSPPAATDAVSAADAAPPAPDAPAAAESAPEAAKESGEKSEASEDSAAGASEAEPEKPDLGMLAKIKDAVMSGDYALAALLAVIFIVGLLRYGASKLAFLEFFTSRAGGYVLVFLATASGAGVTTIGGGGKLGFEEIMQAVLLGLGAIGGFQAYKDMRGKPAEDEPDEEAA